MRIRKPAIVAGVIASTLACVSAHAQITSPLDVPNSVLWLDGDDFDGNGVPDVGVSGTPILNWVDKASGQGVNTVSVTAGAPTIDFGVVGTHNAVHFTGGSTDKLDNNTFTVGTNYT